MRPRRLHRGPALVGLGLVALTLTTQSASQLTDLLGLTLLLATVAQVAVLVRERAPLHDPWWLVAVAVALFTLEYVGIVLLREGLISGPLWPTAIVALELLGYVVAVGVSAWIVRRRSGGADFDGLIDGSIVGCATAVVLWQWTGTAAMGDSTVAVVNALPATMLAIVVAIAIRLAFVASDVPAARWVVGSTLLSFLGQVADLTANRPGDVTPPSAICSILGQVCLVYAALSPSRGRLLQRVTTEPTLLRSRLTMLGLALSAIPLSTALRSEGGQLLAVCGTTAITGLALWRLGRLLHDRERRARHQAALLDLGRLAAEGDPHTLYPGVAAALHLAIRTPAVAVIETRLAEPVIRCATGAWPARLSPAERGRLLEHFALQRSPVWLRGLDYQLWPYGALTQPSGFVAVAVTAVPGDEATVDGAVQILTTGVRRLDAEELLRHASLHDALTGLPNRLLLHRNLSVVAGRAYRSGTPFTVMFLDLDGFKHVNDTLGHGAGDEVLVQAAHRLLQCVRPSDTVARIAGDEFVVVAEETDHDAMTAVARRVVALLSVPMPVTDGVAQISASVGALLVPAPPTSRLNEDHVLQQADDLMYRAKHSGKNTVAVGEFVHGGGAVAALTLS